MATVAGIREQIRHEIELIEPLDETERQCRDDIIDWIDSGAEIFRLRKPAEPPKHLICYSVLVDGEYLLLCDHINAELWLPIGGHVDPDEHPRCTARREAAEELNLEYHGAIAAPVLISTIETVGKTAGHTDVCLWYVLQATRQQVFHHDHPEFNTLAWHHRDELPLQRSDKHLARFARKYFGE